MEWLLRPWHLTILAIANLMNHEEHQFIQYLETENAILREKLTIMPNETINAWATASLCRGLRLAELRARSSVA